MSFFRGYPRECKEHLRNNGEGNRTRYMRKTHTRIPKRKLSRQYVTYWFKAHRRYAEDMGGELEEYRRRLRMQSEAWVFGESCNRQVTLPAVQSWTDNLTLTKIHAEVDINSFELCI